jgi:hypothetical protein
MGLLICKLGLHGWLKAIVGLVVGGYVLIWRVCEREKTNEKEGD